MCSFIDLLKCYFILCSHPLQSAVPPNGNARIYITRTPSLTVHYKYYNAPFQNLKQSLAFWGRAETDHGDSEHATLKGALERRRWAVGGEAGHEGR